MNDKHGPTGPLGHWVQKRIVPINGRIDRTQSEPHSRKPLLDPSAQPAKLRKQFQPANAGQDTFTAWFALETQIHVFGGQLISGYDAVTDMSGIRERIIRHEQPLNALEEIYIERTSAV